MARIGLPGIAAALALVMATSTAAVAEERSGRCAAARRWLVLRRTLVPVVDRRVPQGGARAAGRVRFDRQRRGHRPLRHRLARFRRHRRSTYQGTDRAGRGWCTAAADRRRDDRDLLQPARLRRRAAPAARGLCRHLRRHDHRAGTTSGSRRPTLAWSCPGAPSRWSPAATAAAPPSLSPTTAGDRRDLARAGSRRGYAGGLARRCHDRARQRGRRGHDPERGIFDRLCRVRLRQTPRPEHGGAPEPGRRVRGPGLASGQAALAGEPDERATRAWCAWSATPAGPRPTPW